MKLADLTTTEIFSVPQVDLSGYAGRANDAHQRCAEASNHALHWAVKAGNALNAAKSVLPHGEWGGWVEDNFQGDIRTATNYMRVASDPNRQRVSDLPLRKALKALTQLNKDPSHKWDAKFG